MRLKSLAIEIFQDSVSPSVGRPRPTALLYAHPRRRTGCRAADDARARCRNTETEWRIQWT